MASDDGTTDLVELRPAPAVLLRHRNAELDIVTEPRMGPRVDLKRGALWIRAGEEGPGITVTHGAATVQVRAGAGVVEVNDMDALLVVASGRAAVKGVSPLPRSVIAGQAVTLTLDGTFTDPDALSAAELAADRMVVENLALDSLASVGGAVEAAAAAPVADAPAPAPEPEVEALPTRTPGATTAARTDTPRAPLVPPTSDPFAPRPRPEGADAPSAPVGRPAPAMPPQAEPSALESALAGVGVTDAPPADPVEGLAPPAGPAGAARSLPVLGRTAQEPPIATGPPPRPAWPTIGDTPKEEAPPEEAPSGRKAKAPKTPKEPKPAKKPKASGRAKEAPKGGRTETIPGTDVAATPSPEPADDRRRQRILIGLVIVALIILAIVAAVAFGSDASSTAAL
jgi:hypothetical protein